MRLKNLTEKLRNKHFLSLLGNGVMSLLGMANVAILYRALPMDQVGIWVFFLSTVLLVDTFRSGFITTAFIKFYAGTSDERTAEVSGSTWYVSSLITAALAVITFVCYLVLPKTTNPGLELFFKWAGITYIVTLPSFIATCVLQGEQRFGKLLYVRAINQVIFIALVIIMMVTKNVNIQLIVYANIFSSFVASVFCIIIGWSRINTFSKRTKQGVLELYHFGKYSVGTTLSSNLFRSSDTFIITFLLGPAALAIYNLGGRLMELIEIPLRSFAATAMPSLSAAFNKDDKHEVIYILKKYTGILTMIFIPVVLFGVLLANIPITIIGGEKYAHTEAANIFRFFLIISLMAPADRFFALTIDVINKPKINFFKVLASLFVNVTGDFLGIYLLHNVYGVMLSSFFIPLIGTVVGYWVLNKYQPFAFFDVYRSGLKESTEYVTEQWQKFRLARLQH